MNQSACKSAPKSCGARPFGPVCPSRSSPGARRFRNRGSLAAKGRGLCLCRRSDIRQLQFLDRPQEVLRSGCPEMKPRHWAYLIVGAVLLYPLSIGPVMARKRQMEGAPTRIPAFYKPLEQLAKVSPACREMLLSYLEFWGLPMNRPVRHIRHAPRVEDSK